MDSFYFVAERAVGVAKKQGVRRGEFQNDIIFNKIACVLISNKRIIFEILPITMTN